MKGLDRLVQIDLASLVQLPGVCQEPRDETDEIARHGPVVRELTAKAIEKLDVMRRREGEALFDELMRHVNLIAANLKEIAKLRPDGGRGLPQAAQPARQPAAEPRPSCR